MKTAYSITEALLPKITKCFCNKNLSVQLRVLCASVVKSCDSFTTEAQRYRGTQRKKKIIRNQSLYCRRC